MATLRNDDSKEDDKEELLESLNNVAAHIVDVSLSEEQPDEKNILSHMASIDNEDEHSSYISLLACVPAFYALNKDVPRRNVCDFDSIMIDTGATRGSSGGKRQFFNYCKAMGQKSVFDDICAARCHFGIETTISSGVGNIVFLVVKLWMSFDIHVVNADTPKLRSIDDMDRLGIYMQNLDNFLIHRDSGETAKIARVNSHPYLQRNTKIASYFTFPELRRLHRHFGHPHVDKLVNVLKRLKVSTITPETRKMLEKIERSCAACQEYAQRLRRFKFTLRDDV